MKKIFYKFLSKILPTHTAYAHCDIPCGIYDPKPAQIAAATVLKMVEKIGELDSSASSQNDTSRENSLIRMVWTKEEHARKCKEELLILWTDYFKSEHISSFPNLHEIFWKAAKLCSKNKQNVDLKSAEELVKSVDEIAEIFKKTQSDSNAVKTSKK
ncbi:MAG: superoxide dismutase, Ni [Candidatus Levybacteria bacterium RIFCSPLOWO2_02_FULL_37_10]|nr:MAG: superoxide dismutase, Ni [Candidatus Levybacteria bacterium RIFCSPHIGHO2_01_FULL_37_33]OGH17543.1 MAG: superoxide dismutase, Ni [Candidatus Levybacteria bacterium RIFCSPHIGHO2_02_FULL_37_11]OGH32361.1 MAG: superoxide dismutase, Ni [Candidatus Levybacteria bacterium RIFCSPLOWO2_01_FULL_36_54]OGH46317.1 MAG: superoxide dismutase, Ni [Candidatus Levybacteria bacterium RIFCSPLOWO2_02_FULL_37_10]